MGFDHICIASGAGKPTVIDLKNNLMRGIRKASDFLMALQLTGAAKVVFNGEFASAFACGCDWRRFNRNGYRNRIIGVLSGASGKNSASL